MMLTHADFDIIGQVFGKTETQNTIPQNAFRYRQGVYQYLYGKLPTATQYLVIYKGINLNYMYRLLIYLIALLFISCSFFNKKEKNDLVIKDSIVSRKDINDKNLKDLRLDYGDNIILKSLYFIDKEEKFNFYDWNKLSINDDWINFDDNINLILLEHPDLLNEIFKGIDKRPNEEFLINHIKNWLDTYIILQVHNKYDSVIYFEKIIFEIPKTKDLVTVFLIDESQSWESLSTSQIYELYYTVCNRVYKLSNEEKIQFYKNFFELLYNQLITLKDTD